MSPEQQQLNEHLQRDKEMRVEILGSFYSRLMWLDAAAIAAITAAITAADPWHPRPAYAWGKGAIWLFALSLVVELCVPLLRYHASFNREKRDWTTYVMQWIAAALAIAGVICVAIGMSRW
jgi:hypothetical protein